VSIRVDESMVQGTVAPGFEKVRDEFVRNFTQRQELGAARAAYLQGEKVVDLWGGYRNGKTLEPWLEDTLVLVFSTTKGISGMACALGHSRGSFAYADPDSGAGFAYAMNRSGFYVFGDPRETALSDAFFACIPKI